MTALPRLAGGTAAALLLVTALAGCGGDEGDGGGGAGTTTSVETSARDDAFLAEIKRQMAEDDQTEDVPPPCQGISDARLAELGKIALADQFLPSPKGD